MAEAHCNILRGKGYSNITWASWGSSLQAREGMIRCRWAAGGSEVMMEWNLRTLCSVLALSLSMPPIPILFLPTNGNVTFLPHFPLVNPDNHTSCTPHWDSIGTDEIWVKALRDTVEIRAVQIGSLVFCCLADELGVFSDSSHIFLDFSLPAENSRLAFPPPTSCPTVTVALPGLKTPH